MNKIVTITLVLLSMLGAESAYQLYGKDKTETEMHILIQKGHSIKGAQEIISERINKRKEAIINKLGEKVYDAFVKEGYSLSDMEWYASKKSKEAKATSTK